MASGNSYKHDKGHYFSQLEVLGGHSIDWLFTQISSSLYRGWEKLSASAHAQHNYKCMKGCLWLAETKEFKHTVKASLHITFLSYIYNILPQHVFLEMHVL